MRRNVLRTADQTQVVAPNADVTAQPLQPAPVASRLDMICGRPHLADESRKALVRYAQILRHEPVNEVLAVEESTP